MILRSLLRPILRPATPLSPLKAPRIGPLQARNKTLKAHEFPPRPKVVEDEIEETFLKGSGPGGQKINKTNSAVQLKHIPTGIVVKSQSTRSREQNRKIARRLLAEKLEELEKGEQSRKAIITANKAEKKKRAEKKKKRKYRKLEEEKKRALAGAENQGGKEMDGEGQNAEVEEDEDDDDDDDMDEGDEEAVEELLEEKPDNEEDKKEEQSSEVKVVEVRGDGDSVPKFIFKV